MRNMRDIFLRELTCLSGHMQVTYKHIDKRVLQIALCNRGLQIIYF